MAGTPPSMGRISLLSEESPATPPAVPSSELRRPHMVQAPLLTTNPVRQTPLYAGPSGLQQRQDTFLAGLCGHVPASRWDGPA